jgi:hypothetical protein
MEGETKPMPDTSNPYWKFEELMRPTVDSLLAAIEDPTDALCEDLGGVIAAIPANSFEGHERSQVTLALPPVVVAFVRRIAQLAHRSEVFTFDALLLAFVGGWVTMPDRDVSRMLMAVALRFGHQEDRVGFDAVVHDGSFATLRRDHMVSRGATDADNWIAAAIAAFVWRTAFVETLPMPPLPRTKV